MAVKKSRRLAKVAPGTKAKWRTSAFVVAIGGIIDIADVARKRRS
jgi:hypothetical protein